MSLDSKVFQSTLELGLQEWELGELVDHVPAFTNFAECVIRTNESLNLTRIVEPEEMAIKNFLDSLTLLRLPWQNQVRCLDLGTGAGFPGVPLAIARPEWSFTLLDSLRKRLRFLESAAQEQGLTNLRTLHARAEDAGRAKDQRETYDLVVSRAVAHLPVLLELSIPLVKVGGHFVAYKGSEAATELQESSRALEKLKATVEQVFEVSLPMSMGSRSLLVFRKLASTPSTFPRRAGIPNKSPL